MTDALGRIVADADVLAADLFIDGSARTAIDRILRHSWLTLVASEPLLRDTERVIAHGGDEALGADWREHIEPLVDIVEHAAGDHPALASAKAGDARHVLSLDDGLRNAQTGVSIQPHVDTSVMHPAGFVRLFDPARLYPEIVGGEYPGPDRDPRHID